MLLSGLLPHPCDSVELEQYTTDGDLAARWLADISAFDDLTEGCTVADLGAGNGVLGLGALAMGAGRAILVEADPGLAMRRWRTPSRWGSPSPSRSSPRRWARTWSILALPI